MRIAAWSGPGLALLTLLIAGSGWAVTSAATDDDIAENLQIIKLGYDGSYVGHVEIDGQQFPLLFDTGSDNLVVPASTCAKCSGNDCISNNFNQDCSCKSGVNIDSVQPLKCSDSHCSAPDALTCGPVPHLEDCECSASSNELLNGECYGDGTGYFGLVVSGRVQLGSLSTSCVYSIYEYMIESFACGTALSVGILGLAFRSINSLNVTNPVQQLALDGQIANTFSMCLAAPTSRYVVPIGGAGVFVLGGIGPDYLYTGDVAWANVVSETFYEMDVLNIVSGGVQMDIENMVFILDSGTTDLVLPTSLYRSVMHTLTEDGLIIKFRSSEANGEPVTIVIQNNIDSFGIVSSGVDNGEVILGQPSFWGYHVTFDRDKSRVGFAVQGNCNYGHSNNGLSTVQIVFIVLALVLLVTGVIFFLHYMQSRRKAANYGRLSHSLIENAEPIGQANEASNSTETSPSS
ncbi:uncharacterized protein MONBRDRAFT_30808 [Monosiga brevicollis MX1]|uniref:Peptidase A1 domain-containing protein n=1 Tax=Monosiga brevicollis TaxID=81824 RepID=A9UPE0_MONBE|nr:uncharacterized protein MONBRDRAFT_30808 [Monosiga brevicollis MX1]EDQ92403.1 predicted protein [Monosiga brevicollis MX1]|eukprot:XP_001742165.1 hypothetical protein [Monosiga brevicollis MX1]